jgi:ribonuclease P protein component
MTTPQQPSPKGERNPALNLASQKQSLTGARLRKHADYQAAYALARKHQSSSMSWFLAPRPAPLDSHSGIATEILPVLGPRVGLTAGKVLGKAHERNRIKRRMREVLRRHLDLLPQTADLSADLILHPRRTVLTMDFTKLEAEVVRILNQARSELARMATQPGPENQAAAKSAKRQA